MPATPEDLFRRLDELGIAVETHAHQPVFTVAEGPELRERIPGGHTKNLFLRDKKKRIWLVVAEQDRAVDLKALRRTLGASGSLSFGDPDLLFEVLGVTPGSVTAFGMINDSAGRVSVVIDAGLMRHEVWNAHPLTNDATTSIRREDMLRFLDASGHAPRILDLERPDLDDRAAGE